ncbi:hemerythrin domain-containing protein [Rhodococcus sp. CH91]|uniref:hemerythrin domain-containing protein n=1 Tax=Rhodococcus sp. CH91 TaxID=2910256 RepID=UPI001F4B2449|nr:hemerythrin domain-containing protein [Rhodococcus sp. CH91]
MMNFLHHHHEAEERGLYPLVARRNPRATDLVERMNADHRRIEPAVATVENAAGDLGTGLPGSGEALTTALTRLSDVLLPHLELEEREMMPTLAEEGNWLIDGLDAPSRDYVVHLAPAVPRFILLHVLGVRFRRRFAGLWKGSGAESIPSQPIPSDV